jgi:hypothetical protein
VHINPRLERHRHDNKEKAVAKTGKTGLIIKAVLVAIPRPHQPVIPTPALIPHPPIKRRQKPVIRSIIHPLSVRPHQHAVHQRQSKQNPHPSLCG